MQAPGSFTLVATFIGVAVLAIALSVIIGAPILAVPFIIVGFGVFLVWRGKQRARTPADRYQRARANVPSTQETAADPAGDSGVAEATRSGSSGSHRADASGV